MKNTNRVILAATAFTGITGLLFANISVARTADDRIAARTTSSSVLCIGHKATDEKTQSTVRQEIPEIQKAKISTAHAAEGRLLFYDRGCIVCHTVRNTGGHIAPSLDGLSKRHDWQYVASRIADAEYILKLKKSDRYNNAYAMPPSGLSRYESECVADYIMTLP